MAAETRALLVGVSAYDAAIGLASLRGPANDVRLFRDVLAARGVTDIRLLADGVEGGGQPTRAAILAALADLAQDSAAGDLVFVTLSGHGTRQPDQNGDETDGLDEVFLPADTARAAPGSAAIPNAITDDELGQAVDVIRATGADVWFVMDSCHSGSGLRAGDADVAARFVDPSVLGLRADAPLASAVEPGAEAAPDLPGRLLAFYAARASEVAREVNLTPGAADDSGWYGLFSSRLAARMERAGAQSYRQLFQGVLSDMADGAVPGGARLQTPSWEGDLVDATVFGGAATRGIRQYAVTRDELAAGRVQGLDDGTLVALVADPAAPPDAVLSLAQLEEVTATRAYLRPVAEDCQPQAGQPCATAGRLPAEARYARPLARALDSVLRLAPPADLATGAALPATDPLALALADAMAEVNGGSEARVALDPAAFTVEVAADADRLWFGRRATADGAPAGLSWAPGDGALAPLLLRIARAEELASVLAAVAAAGSPLNPPPVDLGAELRAANPADLDPPGQGGNPLRECRRAVAAAAGPQPLGDAPDLKQCDLLTFSARGAIPGARDVNRIHIDSRFCVHAAHQQIEDAATATALGDPMVMCSDCPDGAAAGDERLFVLITESADNAEPLNLEGLVETCGAAGAPTRGPAAAQAAGFLQRLGRRPDTRGSFGGLNIAEIWVTEYRWRVLPKESVFARVHAAAGKGSSTPPP